MSDEAASRRRVSGASLSAKSPSSLSAATPSPSSSRRLSASCSLPSRNVLGRRKRAACLDDLPDDVLVAIIHHALQMNPQLPGEVSRRVLPRFMALGRTIAQLSTRFLRLLRRAVTSLQVTSRPPHSWLNAMLVFTQRSLTALYLTVDDLPPAATHAQQHLQASKLCLMLAHTRPPLRVFAVNSLAPAPFEHLVNLLRSFPFLREIKLSAPRPVDVAAIAHACSSLRALSLGRTPNHRDVDELRTQFARLVAGPCGANLETLNMSWCCASSEAFKTIGKYCPALEQLAVEFGAIHWIHHRVLVAQLPFHLNLAECGREQRALFRTMLRAVSGGRLRSFAMRTLDGIPHADLDLTFASLSGLTELDLFIGSPVNPRPFSDAAFDKLSVGFGQTLRRVNIVGPRFTAKQVERIAKEFPELRSLALWMGRKERPSVRVFSELGKRIRHLSLLCDWDEEMCAAVGQHNTRLESLFLVTTHLPLHSISAMLTGVRFTLNEFRLFFNRKTRSDRAEGENVDRPQPDEATDLIETNGIVLDAARLVARDCAANLEILTVSAVSGSGRFFVDCRDIAAELRKSAPHLYQICDGVFTD